MREDLYSTLVALAAQALESPGEDAQQKVQAWEQENADRLERLREVLDEIESMSESDDAGAELAAQDINAAGGVLGEVRRGEATHEAGRAEEDDVVLALVRHAPSVGAKPTQQLKMRSPSALPGSPVSVSIGTRTLRPSTRTSSRCSTSVRRSRSEPSIGPAGASATT